MKTADLEAELRAAYSAVGEPERHRLAGLGIDPGDILMLVGMARIRVDRGLYEPEPDGRLAYLTPVLLHYSDTPESTAPDSAVRVGDVVDIVAWHPGRPDRWALRTGAAEWLGCIEPQYLGPAPVHVRRSPLAWLRAACTGLVPLSRSPADLHRLLNGCAGGLVAEDALHATELRRALERPWPSPRIFTNEAPSRHEKAA